MDLYLKAADEATMNAALIAAGLAYEQTVEMQVGETEDGDAILQDVTILSPANGISLDIIGQITRVTGLDANGEPITETLPDWHVNVRCAGLTEEQEAELAGLVIVPPETPYRVWA